MAANTAYLGDAAYPYARRTNPETACHSVRLVPGGGVEPSTTYQSIHHEFRAV